MLKFTTRQPRCTLLCKCACKILYILIHNFNNINTEQGKSTRETSIVSGSVSQPRGSGRGREGGSLLMPLNMPILFLLLVNMYFLKKIFQRLIFFVWNTGGMDHRERWQRGCVWSLGIWNDKKWSCSRLHLPPETPGRHDPIQWYGLVSLLRHFFSPQLILCASNLLCLVPPTIFFLLYQQFFCLVSSTRRWKAPWKVLSRHQQAKFKGPHFLHERTPFQSRRRYCCGRGGQGVRSRWVYNRGSAWSKIYSPSYSYLTAFIIEDVGLVITVMAAIRQERKDYLLHKSTTLETTM